MRDGLRASVLRAIPVIAVCMGMPDTARALEPLSRYLEGARRSSAEARESTADVATREAETRASRAELFPALEASASYTRNQFDIVVRIPDGAGGFEEAPITPRNQLEAQVALTVPLLDIAAIRRVQSARATAQAAGSDRTVAMLELDDRVVADYTRLIAQAALTVASQRALDTAKANLEVVRARESGGLASDLDVRRAMAQVAAAEQTLADAGLQRRSAARRLEATTGVAVRDPIPTLVVDSGPGAAVDRGPDGGSDAGPEAPLAAWLAEVDGADAVVSAGARVRAAEANLRASRAAFIPSLSARASERITNAAGFGEPAQWAVGVTLSTRFDVRTIHRARADRAAVMATEARYDLARRSKRLEIEDAHDRVESLRARARAAASEAKATETALEVARARYGGGTATQLEVVQALRDAFVAEAAQIQATGELFYARAQLRLAAGRTLEDLR